MRKCGVWQPTKLGSQRRRKPKWRRERVTKSSDSGSSEASDVHEEMQGDVGAVVGLGRSWQLVREMRSICRECRCLTTSQRAHRRLAARLDEGSIDGEHLVVGE